MKTKSNTDIRDAVWILFVPAIVIEIIAELGAEVQACIETETFGQGYVNANLCSLILFFGLAEVISTSQLDKWSDAGLQNIIAEVEENWYAGIII